ncbi:hypothetical protein HDU97_002218 [Phlyctochytrium planicorne]|nr:hypothetical protein HDU97_002218 [Phlyctochytrium planicorne]
MYYFYPQALVKQLSIDSSVTFAPNDILAEFNSDFPFYFASAKKDMAATDIDLEFVIAHELTHGLGFDSGWIDFSSLAQGDPTLSIPSGTKRFLAPAFFIQGTSSSSANVIGWQPLKVFDSFITDASTNSPIPASAERIFKNYPGASKPFPVPLKEFVGGIASNKDALDSGADVYGAATRSNGSLTFAPAKGGKAVPLYTPGSLRPGSSISHVDLAGFSSSPDFLMIPILGKWAGHTLDDVIATVSSGLSGTSDLGSLGSGDHLEKKPTQYDARIVQVMPPKDSSTPGMNPLKVAVDVRLFKAFRFPVVVAETEAEAECARLNSLGIVDAVMSDDVDSLLFGGRVVFRSTFEPTVSLDVDDDINSSKKTPVKKKAKVTSSKASRVHGFVDILSADRIEEHLKLNQNGLILTALLNGSDYTDGVKSVGLKTAFHLAQGSPDKIDGRIRGYGETVIDAVLDGDNDSLAIVRNAIEEEGCNNSQRRLQKKRKFHLPDDWPSEDVVRAYTIPILTVENQPNILQSVIDALDTWMEDTHCPNLEEIRTFARDELEWGPDNLRKRMDTVILPALRMRTLRVAAHRRAQKVDVAQLGEVERIEEKRFHEDLRNSRRPSLKRASTVGQESKITHFFPQRKNSGSFGNGLAKTKSDLADFGTSEDVLPDTNVLDISDITAISSARITKTGVEEVRVRLSPEFMPNPDVQSSIAGFASHKHNPFVTSLSSSAPLSPTPKAKAVAGTKRDFSELIEIFSESEEAEEDMEESTETTFAAMWIESGLARILVPHMFYNFKWRFDAKNRNIKNKRKPAPNVATLDTFGFQAATPYSGRASPLSGCASPLSGMASPLSLEPGPKRPVTPILKLDAGRSSAFRTPVKRRVPSVAAASDENLFWGVKDDFIGERLSPSLPIPVDPFHSDDEGEAKVLAPYDSATRAPRKTKKFATLEDLSNRDRAVSPTYHMSYRPRPGSPSRFGGSPADVLAPYPSRPKGSGKSLNSLFGAST